MFILLGFYISALGKGVSPLFSSTTQALSLTQREWVPLLLFLQSNLNKCVPSVDVHAFLSLEVPCTPVTMALAECVLLTRQPRWAHCWPCLLVVPVFQSMCRTTDLAHHGYGFLVASPSRSVSSMKARVFVSSVEGCISGNLNTISFYPKWHFFFFLDEMVDLDL